jgi:inhibitor of cysteine peptidase
MRRLIVVVLVGLVAASCGSDDEQTPVVLDISDSGSEITFEVGDAFEVLLESNPTTGYSWTVAEQPDGVTLVSSDYEEPETSLVGAGGVEVFEFETTAEGSGVLRLDYVRSFDDPVVSADTVEYDLTITGG